MPSSPPAMSTFPLGNNVAVWNTLATPVMLSVAVNLPAAGSYSSALARYGYELLLAPCAISTFPLGNNVAVWPHLATVMLPVVVNVPWLGSYIRGQFHHKGTSRQAHQSTITFHPPACKPQPPRLDQGRGRALSDGA